MLQKDFGQKKGEVLFNFARGIDNTPLKTDHVCIFVLVCFWLFCLLNNIMVS